MKAAEVRRFLARHGLLAQRGRGQNFLVDAGLAARLVALAGVEPEDTVLEIGTGIGALTRALAAGAARVVTLEVDAGLVRALREERLLPDNVELVHADALRIDLMSMVRDAKPPVRIVANLPYSISAPVLRRLLDLRRLVVEWSVMLQREVAERILAQPGTRAYGSLAVLHRLTLEVSRALDLSPRCFYPAPKVRSSFVRMIPLRAAPVRADELEWVERVVRAAFSKRRKMLANALREADLGLPGGADEISRALARADIDGRARAESLTPELLLCLARALARGRDEA